MLKFLSWVIVFCIILCLLSIMVFPFINEALAALGVMLAFFVAIISAILIIILLIRERFHDRKEEQDDLNKY
jgi:membrane protein implicated in regulation of membrane protease activity